jgi:DNA-binding MarR family transcriptional regulator
VSQAATRQRTGVNVPGFALRLGSDIRTAFDRRTARFDLTMQQAGLLIHCADPMTPAQIAPFLGTDTAGMTRLVDRLESRGLLRRRKNPTDRRSILLEPTPKGAAMIPELRDVFRTTSRELMRGFSASEADTLVTLLGRLSSNAQTAGDYPR